MLHSAGNKTLARVVHLSGGIRASNPIGADVIVLPSSNTTPVTLHLERFPDLPSVLSQVCLKTLGIEFTEDADQEAELYPPNWRSLHGAHEYLVDNCFMHWRALANGATQIDDYELFALTARIAFAFQAASLRLRDVSRAYNRELTTLITKERSGQVPE